MTELLTAAQMRAIEQAAIASGKVTGLELIERAGRGVVEAVFEEWPELAKGPHRAVVLCGPGNNGGDGFVVARLLKDWGWEVEVFLYGDPNKLPPDARVNYERWLERGGVKSPAEMCAISVFSFELFVDALFGIGLSRPLDLGDPGLSAAYELAWDFVSEQGTHVVAVDVPSGRCSDSGRSLGPCFPASLVVTFQTAKVGHFLGEKGGGRVDGPIRIVDLELAFVRNKVHMGACAPVRQVERRCGEAAAHRMELAQVRRIGGIDACRDMDQPARLLGGERDGLSTARQIEPVV